jgi:hypothetical protein
LDSAWETLRSELSPKDVARVVRACDEGLFAVREGLLCRLSDSADGFDCLALPVLPPPLRSAVLTALHDTTLHPGRDRTLAVVAARYWWVGMGRDVAAFVREKARASNMSHLRTAGGCCSAELQLLFLP